MRAEGQGDQLRSWRLTMTAERDKPRGVILTDDPVISRGSLTLSSPGINITIQ